MVLKRDFNDQELEDLIDKVANRVISKFLNMSISEISHVDYTQTSIGHTIMQDLKSYDGPYVHIKCAQST